MAHTKAYCKLFSFSKKDLKYKDRLASRGIEESKFPTWMERDDKDRVIVKVEDKQFCFSVKHTARSIGKEWKDTLQVICLSDKELNESTGYGTCFINVLTEEWHQKLLDFLTAEIEKHKQGI